MQISIIKKDNIVVRDGVGYSGIDLSLVADNIHAIQFNTTSNKGHIEYSDGKLNEDITSISSYQSIIDAHISKKTAEDTATKKAEDDLTAFKNTYTYKRKVAYPELTEQLDLLYHDMVADKGDKTGTWFATIKKVKDDNPK